MVLCGNASLVSGAIELTNTDPLTPGSDYQYEAGVAWYGVPVAINGSWTTTFQLKWTDVTADGVVWGIRFIIQNYSNVGQTYTANSTLSGGPNCLMLVSDDRVGNPIPTHPTGVMVYFEISGTANTVGFYSDVPVYPTGTQLATGLTFNGNTYTVTLSYIGTTLSITMGSFSHTWTGVNIPSIVGADAA